MQGQEQQQQYYYRWSKEYIVVPDDLDIEKECLTDTGNGKCNTIPEAKAAVTRAIPRLDRKSKWETLSDTGFGRQDGTISVVLTVMKLTEVTRL